MWLYFKENVFPISQSLHNKIHHLTSYFLLFYILKPRRFIKNWPDGIWFKHVRRKNSFWALMMTSSVCGYRRSKKNVVGQFSKRFYLLMVLRQHQMGLPLLPDFYSNFTLLGKNIEHWTQKWLQIKWV